MNVSLLNHIIHFILGSISYKFYYITGLFLLYQLIDGFKFFYKVVRVGNNTDDIPLDLFFYSIGELSIRYLNKYFI